MLLPQTGWHLQTQGMEPQGKGTPRQANWNRRGEEKILELAFSWRPSACRVDFVHITGLNTDPPKWSEVPFSAAFLLQEFLRDKGEGFQLQTHIHVGVRNINRKEHLRVTEVPAGTSELGGLCLHSFFL